MKEDDEIEIASYAADDELEFASFAGEEEGEENMRSQFRMQS